VCIKLLQVVVPDHFFYFRWDDKERGCNEQACQEKGGKGNNVDGGDTIQTSRVLQFLDIANCLAI
jgi:hypothetical protein